MYCEECGKKNIKSARFCENCGHKLKKEIVIKPKPKEIIPEKRAKKNKKFFIIGFVILIFLIFIYFVFLSNFSAKNVAKKYFVSFMECDSDTYDYLNIEDKEFTSKEIFSEIFDEDVDFLNYRVVSENVSDDHLSATVMINYTLSNSKTQTKKIHLKRDGRLSFWKVENEDFVIIEDKKIKAPSNSKIYLEDVLVSSKYLKDDVYTIPSMFKGEYDVTVVLENGLTLEDDVVFNSFGSANLCSLSVKDEDKLKDSITSSVNLIYDNIISDKDLDVSGYDDFKKSVSKKNIVDFDLKKIDILDTTVKDNLLHVSFKMNYEYVYTYDWFGSEKEKSKSGLDTVNFVFDYDDGVYKLKEIL